MENTDLGCGVWVDPLYSILHGSVVIRDRNLRGDGPNRLAPSVDLVEQLVKVLLALVIDKTKSATIGLADIAYTDYLE